MRSVKTVYVSQAYVPEAERWQDFPADYDTEDEARDRLQRASENWDHKPEHLRVVRRTTIEEVADGSPYGTVVIGSLCDSLQDFKPLGHGE